MENVILAFFEKAYSFNDEKGQHHEGVTPYVVLLKSENKKNVGCDIAKIGKDCGSYNVGDRGTVVSYDRFGRFIGLR